MAYCISSEHLSILVHGTPSSFFSSSRGLRQGDPLSPFLFVFVIEALGKMILALVDGGLLSGFMEGSRSDGAINISYLLFADGTLIFSKANPNHRRNLRSLFLCFEAVSGLRINLAKSELVSVRNEINVEGLVSIWGYRVSSFGMKYLGLPLGALFKVKSI
jgi:hypothetical protein